MPSVNILRKRVFLLIILGTTKAQLRKFRSLRSDCGRLDGCVLVDTEELSQSFVPTVESNVVTEYNASGSYTISCLTQGEINFVKFSSQGSNRTEWESPWTFGGDTDNWLGDVPYLSLPCGETKSVIVEGFVWSSDDTPCFRSQFLLRPTCSLAPTSAPTSIITTTTPTTVSPTPAPTEGGSFLIRINAGSSTAFTDSQGRTWQPDQFSAGLGSSFEDCDEDIMMTADDTLYCTYRQSTPGGRFNPSPGPFSYEIPVPRAGQYNLTLYFAETATFSATGSRQAEIVVQSNVIASAFNIIEAAEGQRLRPVVLTTSQPVFDGDTTFTVDFNLVSGASFPRVSALELVLLEDSTLSPSLAPTTLAPTISPDILPLRIRAGFFNNPNKPPSRYFDPEGNLWHLDRYFEGGSRNIFGCPDNVPLRGLLCSAHSGSLFRYDLPVPVPGLYSVTLFFMETRFPGTTPAIFNVTGEASPIATEFDPLQVAGGQYELTTLSATEMITDGFYSLVFTEIQSQAFVNAIQLDASG